MSERSTLLDLAQRAAIPVATLILIGYFLFHAVAGNTGLLAWREYQVEHRQLEAQAREVAARREVLERHTKLLDPRRVNPDFADQLARENLGVLGPDEVIIDLPPPPA